MVGHVASHRRGCLSRSVCGHHLPGTDDPRRGGPASRRTHPRRLAGAHAAPGIRGGARVWAFPMAGTASETRVLRFTHPVDFSAVDPTRPALAHAVHWRTV